MENKEKDKEILEEIKKTKEELTNLAKELADLNMDYNTV